MTNTKKTHKENKAPAWATDSRSQTVQALAADVTKVIVAAIKWIGIGFCFWQGQLALASLAGKKTIAIGDIKFGANAEVDLINFDCIEIVAMAVLIGILGIVYGAQQAKLRRRAVERLHPYKEMYERSLDPERRSSKLTTTGDTRPEDR